MTDATATTESTNTANGGTTIAGVTTNADGGAKAGAVESKVVFTPEQQTKVQSLIDEAYSKAFEKAMHKVAETGKPRDATLPDAQIKTLNEQVNALRNEKKKVSLFASIAKHNVVDAEEIISLMETSVKLNADNSLAVVNSAGVERLGISGAPMSVDEFVGEWLKSRPHHLRASSSQGAGSQGSRSIGAGGVVYDLSRPETVRTMPRAELDKMLAAGITVDGSAGQSFGFKTNTNKFAEARSKQFGENKKG